MMKPALVYPWSLINADGSKAAMSGFSWGRLQAHEMSEFRKLNPDAEAALHVSLNSVRKFGGVWRERDATQVAPAPTIANPWPILHQTTGTAPEVFYDIRDRRVQIEAVDWLLAHWDPRSGLLMLDDVQLKPLYLGANAHDEWAAAWLRIVHRLKSEGYTVGVNLWPVTESNAAPILDLCDCVMIERFAPEAAPDLVELWTPRIVMQWFERPGAPDATRRTAAAVVASIYDGESFWAIDDGRGRQYHPMALAAPNMQATP